MKKLITLLLALTLLVSLTACGASTDAPTTEPVQTTTAAPTEATTLIETTAAPTEPTTAGASDEAKAALDGKRVLFIGNSYTYWGSVVINKSKDILEQSKRSNDKGLFYQLCKENGMDVSVTNWVFGNHDLTDIMSHECLDSASSCVGKDHMAYFDNAAFDYVAIQLYVEDKYAGDLMAHLQPTLDFFQEANPDVKFLLLVPHMTYVKKYAWRDQIATVADAGITVVNWGSMLDDIVNGLVEVPGAKQQYFIGSFVISRSAKDGHHQNLLVGYLTALMVYSAITGDSAVGQPYGFADDPSIHPNFDMEAFQQEYYTHEPYTNFVDIYRSESDMLGLQQLTDLYLSKFNGGN